MPTTALDRYITRTRGVRSGRPRIARTRITVDDIVIMHLHMGQSLEDISATYDLPLAAVYAAMAYYFDHRVAIDRKVEEDDAYVEAARKRNPSKLKARLKALRVG